MSASYEANTMKCYGYYGAPNICNKSTAVATCINTWYTTGTTTTTKFVDPWSTTTTPFSTPTNRCDSANFANYTDPIGEPGWMAGMPSITWGMACPQGFHEEYISKSVTDLKTKVYSDDECIALVKKKNIQWAKEGKPIANAASMSRHASHTKEYACNAEFRQRINDPSSDTTHMRTCIFDDCPFSWMVGDGNGREEKYVGEADTATDCIKLVKTNMPTANAATYPSDGKKECWGEVDETAALTDYQGHWKTCIFEQCVKGWRTGKGENDEEEFVGEFVGQVSDKRACISLVKDTSPNSYGCALQGNRCHAINHTTINVQETEWETCTFIYYYYYDYYYSSSDSE